MRKTLPAFLLLILCPLISFADCLKEDIIPGKYIVRLKKSGSSSMRAMSASPTQNFSDFLNQSGLSSQKIFEEKDLSLLSAEESIKNPPSTYIVENVSDEALAQLQSHSSVDTVENDCLVKLQGELSVSSTTNDPREYMQWALKKIQAEDAWSINSGSSDIIVGISDTGVDYTHEDLKENMWINKGEIPKNNIDDDNNGCIDDIYGCDLADHTGNPMPNSDTLSHGTHVAGIAAARGNNGVGISGVTQKAKILAVKGFSYSGEGTTAVLLQTVYYAVNNGARVVNCSWGREGTPTQAEKDAFDYAYNHGVVMVVASGNNNFDSARFTPANLPHVITVAATDSQDQIGTYSNWGTTVTVAAPGGQGYDAIGRPVDGILSLLPGDTYGTLAGTSMAAPHVTGLVALLLSINPKLKPDEIKQIIQDGGDAIHVTTTATKDQPSRQFDYKRINAYGSAKLALDSLTNPIVTRCTSTGSTNCKSSALSGTPSSLDSNLGGHGTGCGSISNTKTPPDIGGALFFLLMPLFFLGLNRFRLFQTNRTR